MTADSLPPDLLDRQALIGDLVFTATRYEWAPYPGTSKVWGYFHPSGAGETSIRMAQWNAARKNDEMRAYLADYWQTVHNLRVGSTYTPARNNRRKGPTVYKITELLGTNLALVNGNLYITAAEFNAWKARTATRAKRG